MIVSALISLCFDDDDILDACWGTVRDDRRLVLDANIGTPCTWRHYSVAVEVVGVFENAKGVHVLGMLCSSAGHSYLRTNSGILTDLDGEAPEARAAMKLLGVTSTSQPVVIPTTTWRSPVVVRELLG